MSARPRMVGPFTVELITDDEAIASRWEALFAGFPAAPGDGALVQVAIHRADDGRLRSSVNGEHLIDDADLSAHELAITRVLNHRKLDAEIALVHIHAAAVAHTGRAVILSGRSGDGKSTLTAHLIRNGWEYATDEQVTLGPDDRTIEPYPRPLTLRRGVWHLFPGIGDDLGGDDYRRVETSLAQLGGAAATGPLTPTAIVAPQYSKQAVTALAPFGDAAAVVQHLASCCHDLERTGARGCAALVHLASTCAAFRLPFSDADAAALLVDDAFAQASTRPAVGYQRIDAAADAPVHRGVVQRAPGTTAWLFADGSGIALHPDRLRLAQLDTLGCALWEVLEQPDSTESILADAPTEAVRSGLASWLTRLLDAGLLLVG